jgi:hypothetical protein
MCVWGDLRQHKARDRTLIFLSSGLAANQSNKENLWDDPMLFVAFPFTWFTEGSHRRCGLWSENGLDFVSLPELASSWSNHSLSLGSWSLRGSWNNLSKISCKMIIWRGSWPTLWKTPFNELINTDTDCKRRTKSDCEYLEWLWEERQGGQSNRNWRMVRRVLLLMRVRRWEVYEVKSEKISNWEAVR